MVKIILPVMTMIMISDGHQKINLIVAMKMIDIKKREKNQEEHEV
jgi:hypothetical protein